LAGHAIRTTDTPELRRRNVTAVEREGVAAYAGEAEHSLLVILFTDIVESTRAKERRTHDDYQSLRREHDHLLATIIGREGGGTVIKHTGDGYLAVFTRPDVAVLRALEMQRVMREHELTIRVGIHMGQVDVEPSVGDAPDVFGHNVDWAARAEALAKPGHTCVTQPVYADASRRLNSGVCSWKKHGEYVVKDGETPLDIWEPHEADAAPMDAPRGRRLYGEHPKTWHVPVPRNRNFTGREDILTTLYDSLHGNDRAALTQTDAIHGLGGIGKTQIAAEYAHRYAGAYECVWWVAAEDGASRQTGYAGLAQRLGLPEKDAQDQAVTVAAVREWIRLNDKWLLILDNAPDADAVADLLPDGNSGHIVITSRGAAWRGTAQPMPVATWPRAESIEFLRARTGDESDAASTLAGELGDLPLALEQAAAYMDAAGMSYDEYLACYREDPVEALATSAPRAHPDPVARTWAVSMECLQRALRIRVKFLGADHPLTGRHRATSAPSLPPCAGSVPACANGQPQPCHAERPLSMTWLGASRRWLRTRPFVASSSSGRQTWGTLRLCLSTRASYVMLSDSEASRGVRHVVGGARDPSSPPAPQGDRQGA
jgi:class 3 adenylate cyclase